MHHPIPDPGIRPAVVGRQQLGSSKGQGLAGGSYDPAWSRGLVLAAAGTL